MGQTSSRLGADRLSKRDNDLGALEPLHLSVIIPALNESACIAAALNSVRLAVVPPLEVLVVDGGSTDDTVQQAQGLGAKVIRSERGRGRQLNSGWRAARGDWCLFLHSDSTLPLEYDRHISSSLRRAAAHSCERRGLWAARLRKDATPSQDAPAERISPGSGDALDCSPAPGRLDDVCGGGPAADGRTCELFRGPTACQQPLRLGAELLKGSGTSRGSGGTSRSGIRSASGGSGGSRGSRHGGDSDRVSGDALGVVRCADVHRGAVPGLWAVRRPASPCAGEDGCGGRNRVTWPTWGAFASIDTDLRNPLLRTALSAAVQLRTRVFSRPYGDQALFVRRDVLEACGGFAEWPLLEDLDLVTRLSQERGPVIVDAHIRTSGRRWQSVGFVRTTALNQVILAAYALGVSPETLADWYQNGKRAMGA